MLRARWPPARAARAPTHPSPDPPQPTPPQARAAHRTRARTDGRGGASSSGWRGGRRGRRHDGRSRSSEGSEGSEALSSTSLSSNEVTFLRGARSLRAAKLGSRRRGHHVRSLLISRQAPRRLHSAAKVTPRGSATIASSPNGWRGPPAHKPPQCVPALGSRECPAQRTRNNSNLLVEGPSRNQLSSPPHLTTMAAFKKFLFTSESVSHAAGWVGRSSRP